MNLAALQPSGDGILVEVIAEMRPSPVQIVSFGKPGVRWGRVVAVGPGRRLKDGTRRPVDVRAGDVVSFDNFVRAEAGNRVLIGEMDVLVVGSA
jgi:chaperonin GroES